MPARRNWRLDLAATAWIALGVASLLCVLDAPRSLFTQLGIPINLLTNVVPDVFGGAAFLLPIFWFILAVMLTLRRQLKRWLRRLAGWLLLIPISAVLAEHLAFWLHAPGGEIHGGTFGRWLNEMLERHAPEDAQPLLLSLGVAISVVLALGEFLVYPLRASIFVLRAVFGLGPAVPADYLADVPQVAGSGKVARAAKANDSEQQKTATVGARKRGAALALSPGPAEDFEPEGAEPVIIPIRRPQVTAEVRSPAACSSTSVTVAVPTFPRLSLLSFLRPTFARFKNEKAEPPAQEPAAPTSCAAKKSCELPALSLLEDPQPFPYEKHEQHLRGLASLLEKTFADFDLNVRVVGINTGPVVTQFEIALETGLRVHKVTRLADDLALNLKVPSVRVVAPIPGKNTVGIEVPNELRASVRLKEVIQTAGNLVAKAKIPLFLGKDTEGKPLVHDLADMPHLLIAGRTGTGKSVCMNAIILSILMTRRPDEVKMVMIDPKMLELSEYGKIPHLMHPVVKDMKKAEAILAWAVDKMEERYDILSRARVRSIAGYNELIKAEIHRRLGYDELTEEERSRIPDRMPYIVIFVDEMNDLMMTMKKEVEGHIIRLAQKSRAAGIHLVVATQKPTVDVITGLIKSNLPARICFQVSSRSDSRVVLDEMGAEKLLGKGDMLFLIPGTSTIVRAQGTYASDAEIAGVVKHLECEPHYSQELIQISSNAEPAASAPGGPGVSGGGLRARDELYEAAIEVIVREGRGSVSLLQRALGIGYGRAARLIDFMAEDGIVGDYNGSQAREVLYTPEQWEALKERQDDKSPRSTGGLGMNA